MKEPFVDLIDDLLATLRSSEHLSAHLLGESTRYVSFNQSHLRQASAVERSTVRLRLVTGDRHAATEIGLTGDRVADRTRSDWALKALRSIVDRLPPDPFLQLPPTGASIVRLDNDRLPPLSAMVDDVLTGASGRDLVGLLAAGQHVAGFADSLGQRSWFERSSYLLDVSLQDLRPVHKFVLAGVDWPHDIARMLDGRARPRDPVGPPRILAPGAYRVYLEPFAVAQLLDLLGKDGFSARCWQRGTGFLGEMRRGEVPALHPAIRWSEDTASGTAPPFDSWGFHKPECTTLAEGRVLRSPLVSPRSAAEYGLVCTAAGDWEQPDSLVMDAGSLREDEAMECLDTGLSISSLHYLNPAGTAADGFTGTTRYATWLVENGRRVAPVETLRIEDRFSQLFGDGLVALTERTGTFASTDTVGGRSTKTIRAPGLICRDVHFV